MGLPENSGWQGLDPPTALPPLLAASWPAAPLRDLGAALSSLSSHTPTWSSSQGLVSGCRALAAKMGGGSLSRPCHDSPKELGGFQPSQKGGESEVVPAKQRELWGPGMISRSTAVARASGRQRAGQQAREPPCHPRGPLRRALTQRWRTAACPALPAWGRGGGRGVKEAGYGCLRLGPGASDCSAGRGGACSALGVRRGLHHLLYRSWHLKAVYEGPQ